MAKLLPFITERSSESAIYKAILQRTKGSAYSTVTNLYSIILNMGIEETRKKFDTYSQDLSAVHKIAALLTDHPQYHVPKSAQLFWVCVSGFEEENTDKDYAQYSKEEKEIFFSVLAVTKPESLAGAGFNLDIENYAQYAEEDFNEHVKTFSNIKITEKDSERVGLTSWEELKAFTAYSNANTEDYKFLPVYLEVEREETNQELYAKHHCINPYIRN